MVFISETRQQSTRVSNLRSRLGLNKSFVVDGQGKGGGLVLFWDDSINIKILLYECHYIDTLIWDAEHNAHWRGTFVYGEPHTHSRGEMWELLKRLKPLYDAPWMLIGDFNEAMWSFKQFSSRRRPARQMQAFRDALNHCDVYDLGFIGLPWTFDNKQKGEKNVKVRLDKVVASPSWKDWFKDARVRHLVSSRSDHLPILLDLLDGTDQGKPLRISRYELMWEREESLSSEIERAWDFGTDARNLGDIAGKLRRVMTTLKS
jgi:hypothetical protein